MWPFTVMAALSPLAGYVVGQTLFYPIGRVVSALTGQNLDRVSLILVTTLAVLLIGAATAIVRANANAKVRPTREPARVPATPTGYTTDGYPIYPIVGYTPAGQPVTADRAVLARPAATGTNSMAIAACITGAIPATAPLGIAFGHIAQSQIRQTGQRGSALAIAGLVLGYLWVTLFALALVANSM